MKADHELAPARSLAPRRAGIEDVLLLDSSTAQLLLFAAVLAGLFLLADPSTPGDRAPRRAATVESPGPKAPLPPPGSGERLVAAWAPPGGD